VGRIEAAPKSAIDTAAKRAKLAPRRNPYWRGISGGRGGVSLGYRKPAHGAGAWVAKLVIDKRRIEERLAAADDPGAEAGALPYSSAISETLAWARRKFAGIEAGDPKADESRQSARPYRPTFRNVAAGWRAPGKTRRAA
jgi:hypothetical protein